MSSSGSVIASARACAVRSTSRRWLIVSASHSPSGDVADAVGAGVESEDPGDDVGDALGLGLHRVRGAAAYSAESSMRRADRTWAASWIIVFAAAWAGERSESTTTRASSWPVNPFTLPGMGSRSTVQPSTDQVVG